MKIKSQVRIFLIGMIAIPLICLIGIPIVQALNAETRDFWRAALFYTVIGLAILETFAIFLTITISNTISKSISMLEQNTKLITGGELDVKFETPKNKHSDNEITNLTENLEKMRVALKENEERKNRFIMGISHDLRTPIAVIKGYTEAISDGMISSPEEIKKSLSIVETKTTQLEDMIETLISFVKLNNTDWLKQLEPQKIKPFLEEFAKTSEATGTIFKRKTTTNISINDDTMIKFDRGFFQRALENLFSNAIRYTKDGDEIIISAIEDKDKIEISIADRGVGIEKEDKLRIFDLFFRGTNSRREEGLGIGLSVVKNIVDTHGWKIEVESEKNEGSKFIITIPKENRSKTKFLFW